MRGRPETVSGSIALACFCDLCMKRGVRNAQFSRGVPESDQMNPQIWKRWCYFGALLLGGGAAGLCVLVLREVGPATGRVAAAPERLAWVTDAWPELDLPRGDVFARPGDDRLDEEVAQYRLAGTFRTYDFREGARDDVSNGASARNQLALVDDLRDGRQWMLRRGERLGPFTVSEIDTEQVVLTREERSWVLTLPGVLVGPRTEVVRGSREGTGGGFEDMPALETTPFGKRIAENQWVIDRDAVVAYAEQLAAEPRRAIALYDSFTSVTPETEDDLAGFRLQMAGEREFFGSMGLADGDIIRKVNSMQMKSQRRAEYLVREFMHSRMSAVVLDIEREGDTRQHIYIVR